MENESLFLTRDCLASLSSDRSLASFELACRGGAGLLRIHANPGSQPGLTTGESEHPFDIVFAPDRVSIAWTAQSGERHTALFEMSDDVQDLASLVNDPLTLPHLAVALDLDRPAPLEPALGLAGPVITADALRILIRHAAVTDLLFGSDGRECSLQFQVRRGFAGVDQRPPNDWIGLDFTESEADLAWFDENSTFQIQSFHLPEDADQLSACLADPLGRVALAGSGSGKNDAP